MKRTLFDFENLERSALKGTRPEPNLLSEGSVFFSGLLHVQDIFPQCMKVLLHFPLSSYLGVSWTVVLKKLWSQGRIGCGWVRVTAEDKVIALLENAIDGCAVCFMILLRSLELSLERLQTLEACLDSQTVTAVGWRRHLSHRACSLLAWVAKWICFFLFWPPCEVRLKPSWLVSPYQPEMLLYCRNLVPSGLAATSTWLKRLKRTLEKRHCYKPFLAGAYFFPPAVFASRSTS